MQNPTPLSLKIVFQVIPQSPATNGGFGYLSFGLNATAPWGENTTLIH